MAASFFGSSKRVSSPRNKKNARRNSDIRNCAPEALEARLFLYGGVDRLVNNNAGATGTGFFTQSETSLIAYGNNVVIGFNDSGSNNIGTGPGAGITGSTGQGAQLFAGPQRRGDSAPAGGGGGAGSAGFTGWSRSTDGGTTFTDGGSLPEAAGGHAGDPVVVRDSVSGRIYMSTLGFTVSTIRMFRSDNDAASWQPAIVGTPGGSSEDKQWVAVDNFAGAQQGNVYLISRRFGAPTSGINFHRSTDDGATYSTALNLWTGGQGAWVVVAPNHDVYAFSLQGTQIQMRKSIDAGVSFAAATPVVSGQGGGTNGDLALTGMRNGVGVFNNFRSNGFPQCVINPVNSHMYLVYANNPTTADKADIQMVMSTNAGATWSAPVRVNDDAGLLDQWQPTIAVTPDGTRLGVFYYSRQEDGTNNQFRYRGRLANISGATVTFTPSENISDVQSLPEFGRDSLVNSVYMGDYDQAAATNDAFHVVWADNRSALPGGGTRMDPNVYYDKISLAVAPTVTGATFGFLTRPHTVSFTFSQDVSASLSTADIELKNLTTNTIIPAGQLSLSYNGGTNTATFSYIGPGQNGLSQVLPDGTYDAKLIAAGITNSSGIPLAADVVHNFFFLQGDADRDNDVDFDDYFEIDNGFNNNQSGWQNGDFDYDGDVDFDDYFYIDFGFNNQ